jgi:hypothetical protein
MNFLISLVPTKKKQKMFNWVFKFKNEHLEKPIKRISIALEGITFQSYQHK